MCDCKSANVPMQPKLQLPVKPNRNCKLPYRELIGCLMYLMLGSRPDLSFCVTYFSQFQNNFSDEHWNHLKSVLRYLKQTVNYGLKFTKCNNTNVNLLSYVDSDFANSIVDRKSITGFVIKLNNNVIHWKTKRQNNVLSSAESKYVALATCVTENLFLAQILAEIANFNVYPITVFEDNQSCIKMASTFESKRSKHINIKHHFVRECVTQNKIKLLYINSNKQQADMFTKQLAATKFKYFRDSLNVTLLNEKES